MDKRPDIAYIRKYVNGELSPREMFEIEKATHEDEVLMDIVLGLEAEKEQGADAGAVKALWEEIANRSNSKPKSTKVIAWKVIGIAASFLLIMGIGIALWLRQDSPEESLIVDLPVVTDESGSRPTEEVTHEPTEERLVTSTESDDGKTRLRKKETRTIAHVPDIIELELPQPRHDREKGIPFGVSSSEQDSAQVLASTPIARSRMVGSVSSSGRSGAEERIMIRGMSTQKKEGSSNIADIPVDEIKSITTGIVVDPTQQPAIGAAIKDLKTKKTVYTDSTGRFVIASTEEKTNIQVDYLGYETVTLAANGSMRIELNPDKVTLEEVVVSGYGKNIKKSKSEPAMGTRAYRRYIDNIAKNTNIGKGTVILIFGVDRNGRPINIRVKQSAGTEHDQSAIRIVKEGPEWIPGHDGEDVEWKVNF